MQYKIKVGHKILYNGWGKNNDFEVWTVVAEHVCSAASKQIGLSILNEPETTNNGRPTGKTFLQAGLKAGFIRLPPIFKEEPQGFSSTRDLYMNLTFPALEAIVSSLYTLWLGGPDDGELERIVAEIRTLNFIITKHFKSGDYIVAGKISQILAVNTSQHAIS